MMDTEPTGENRPDERTNEGMPPASEPPREAPRASEPSRPPWEQRRDAGGAAGERGNAAAPPAQTIVIQQPKRSGWRVFWGIVLVLSILGNIFLFMALLGIGAVIATGAAGASAGGFLEQTVVEGRFADKIAMIHVEGFMDGGMSENLRVQFQAAAEDPRVRAVLLRVATPGGMVTASDQIHHAITKFREETGKPVVAFMQGMATSGGYYASVACNRILAEPTTITGSIGVIMSTLVIEDLLQEKLGIKPVVIKSGPKKDWPSIYAQVDEVQQEYLFEKVIAPAYERFVMLVAQGREGLTLEEVRPLADGSIYTAEEAMEVDLIDAVGYFEEAVALTEKMAGVSGATVVEYVQPLSLSGLLLGESESRLRLDRETIEELAAPRILYMWQTEGGVLSSRSR